MEEQEGGPPFMRGFMLARRTLLALREKKIREGRGGSGREGAQVDNYVAPTGSHPRPEDNSHGW